MTSFNNLSQSERESILNRIREVSDDDAIDLIKDSRPAAANVIWSSQKVAAEISTLPIIYAIALG